MRVQQRLRTKLLVQLRPSTDGLFLRIDTVYLYVMEEENQLNEISIYCDDCGTDITLQHTNDHEEEILCDGCFYAVG